MFRELCVDGQDYGIIPYYLRHYAEDIVRLRLQANRENYRGKPQKVRPGKKDSVLLGEVDRDYYTDYVGILGELIVRRYFEIDPRFEWYASETLIQARGSDGSDIKVMVSGDSEPVEINVKSGEGSLKANKRAVDIGTSDVFIFINFISETMFVPYKFSVKQIQKWDIKHAYSPYYNLNV
jgi:hypothetical protein